MRPLRRSLLICAALVAQGAAVAAEPPSGTAPVAEPGTEAPRQDPPPVSGQPAPSEPAPSKAAASGGGAAPAPTGILDTWEATELRDHPLVGFVWSPIERAFVAPMIMRASLGRADVALIGEVHDNPDHHRIQSYAIKAMTTATRKPAVVMEMLNIEQADVLEAFFQDPQLPRIATQPEQIGPKLDQLFNDLQWDRSGWPSRTIYRPVFESAVIGGLRLYPGSDKRKSVRAIGKAGLDYLSVRRLRRLGLDADLPADLTKQLKIELKESHCDLIPENALAAMSTVQRYRDGYMAAALARHTPSRPKSRHKPQETAPTADGAAGGSPPVAEKAVPQGALLIAGNGHVRKDRGVPWYLDRILNDEKIVIVMAMEVLPGKTDPASYVLKSPDGEPTADFVVFTPRVARNDPCAEMRKQLPAKP